MKKFVILSSILFFSLFFSAKVHAATLDLLSDKDTYKIGESFDVNLKIDSEADSVNGVQTTIKFDTTILDATATDKTNSIFDWWLTDPTISNGEISFIAASTSGFSGKSLQVLKITFKVKGAGTGDVTLSDSAITSADGSGSNVLSTSNNLKVKLAASVGQTKPTQIIRPPAFVSGSPTEPEISVPLYPDPTKWNNAFAKFFVNIIKLPGDVSEVALILDKSATTIPTQSEGLFETKEFSPISDGIYYLHARYKNNIGWGPTRHYKIMNDITPPSKFSIVFPNGEPTDQPTPAILFKSSDSLSGITRYSVRVDGNSSLASLDGTLNLPLQTPGKHALVIDAYDNAGNATSSIINYEIISIDIPIISYTNTKVFTGEGGFFISGTVNPKLSVRVELKDQNGNAVHSETARPNDKGDWSLNINIAFKKETYYFEVASVDDRGAVSTVVRSPIIKVEDKPVLSIGALNITPFWFFILSFFVVILAFILGLLFWRSKQGKVLRRIFIAERDTQGLIDKMKVDVENLRSREKLNTNKKSFEANILETKEIVDSIGEGIDKMQKYAISDIEDIGKK